MNTFDIQMLKEALLTRLHELIRTLYGDRAKLSGSEWRIGNVKGDVGSSLAIEGCNPTWLGLWHDYNPNAEKRSGDVLDLIAGAQATDFIGAVAWARAFLGDTAPSPAVSRTQMEAKTKNSTGIRLRSGAVPGLANERSLKQATAVLLRHKAAMAQLRKRGLKRETIRHFHLGLYSYEGQTGGVRDALSYPVLDAKGRPIKRYLRSRLDRVTVGGPDAKDWAAGKPGTYWVTPSEGRRELFVCEGAKDGWWLWQALQRSPLLKRLCIISSTHGSGIPEPWHDPTFWQSWERVYLAQDNDEPGEALAHRVREVAGRDVYRVRVPLDYGEDWTDFFRSRQTTNDFVVLLEKARVFGMEIHPAPISTLPDTNGVRLADARDTSRTFVNGYLYLPFRSLERLSDDVEGEVPIDETVQRYRTLVLRSDGVVCTIRTLPAPRGTPRTERVLALSDGTLITRVPTLDKTRSTLSPGALVRFRECRRLGKSALTLSFPNLVEALGDTLRASVVLARPDDYALLTLVVLASHVQAVFDAFPLIELQGPGSSEVGSALTQLGYNPTCISGRSSAFEVAKRLDHSSGLSVIESLEGIAHHSPASDFRAFIQQLASSTSKNNSRAYWTYPKTFRVKWLDFYGVKVISKLGSSAETLREHSLIIHTREATQGTKKVSILSPTYLSEMRDNLHLWAFENAHTIHHHYQDALTRAQSSQEILRAPLQVLADLLDHSGLSESLQAALALQEQEPPKAMSSVQRVHMAVRSLIRQGYQKKLTLKQLMLELHLQGEDDAGEPASIVTSEWQEPRWVGRTLRAEKLIDPQAKDERRWLWGEQTRVVTLEPGFVARTLEELEAQNVALVQAARGALEFCLLRPCDACPYASFCTMRPRKEKRSSH